MLSSLVKPSNSKCFAARWILLCILLSCHFRRSSSSHCCVSQLMIGSLTNFASAVPAGNNFCNKIMVETSSIPAATGLTKSKNKGNVGWEIVVSRLKVCAFDILPCFQSIRTFLACLYECPLLTKEIPSEQA